jgi:large subunit ribosomal protein L15
MLDRLKPRDGSTRKAKRVGRGRAGHGGKTAGRGIKGQGKRSAGREVSTHFEGGQMPIVRRLPKRGFHNLFRKEYQVINLAALSAFGDGATVDLEALTGRGLVRRRGGDIKILGEGDAPKNLTLKVNKISAGARTKVEAAGGTVELV